MARAAAGASALRARRAPSYGWYYDDTGHYAYVLVDGDKKMCDVLCRRLETRGIACLGKGPSGRPASDGRVYDFFIRVSEKEGAAEGTGRHPARGAVIEAFRGLPQFDRSPVPTAGDGVPRAGDGVPRAGDGGDGGDGRSRETLSATLAGAVAETERLQGEVGRLREVLGEERANGLRIRRLYERVIEGREKLRLDFARYREQSGAESRRLREELERGTVVPGEGAEDVNEDESTGEVAGELRREVAALEEKVLELGRTSAELEEELTERDLDVSELYQVWGEAEQSGELAKGALQDLENRLYMTQHENSELAEEVYELREFLRDQGLSGESPATPASPSGGANGASGASSDGSSPPVSSKDIEELYKRVFAYLVPNLCIERGSVSVLATEFRDDRGTLENLRKLDSEPAAVLSERVERAPKWREVKYHVPPDGKIGRIYYTRSGKSKPGEVCCRVLIGHKHMQEQDVEWLKRNS